MSRKLSSCERYWQRKRAMESACQWADFYGRQTKREEKAQYERTLRLLRERLDARRAEKTDD